MCAGFFEAVNEPGKVPKKLAKARNSQIFLFPNKKMIFVIYIYTLYANIYGIKFSWYPGYPDIALPRLIWLVVLLFYVHGKHLRSCRDGHLT